MHGYHSHQRSLFAFTGTGVADRYKAGHLISGCGDFGQTRRRGGIKRLVREQSIVRRQRRLRGGVGKGG